MHDLEKKNVPWTPIVEAAEGFSVSISLLLLYCARYFFIHFSVASVAEDSKALGVYTMSEKEISDKYQR